MIGVIKQKVQTYEAFVYPVQPQAEDDLALMEWVRSHGQEAVVLTVTPGVKGVFVPYFTGHGYYLVEPGDIVMWAAESGFHTSPSGSIPKYFEWVEGS